MLTLSPVMAKDLLNFFACDEAQVWREFFQGAKLGLPPVKGIFVIQDEAYKVFEPLEPSVAAADQWKDKSAGQVLVGDSVQQGNVNTASKAYNHQSARADVSFPERCMLNGVPMIERMLNRMLLQ